MWTDVFHYFAGSTTLGIIRTELYDITSFRVAAFCKTKIRNSARWWKRKAFNQMKITCHLEGSR